jgi:hypothetical protein
MSAFLVLGCSQEKPKDLRFLADTLSNSAAEYRKPEARAGAWARIAFCDSSAKYLEEYYSTNVPSDDIAEIRRNADSALLIAKIQIATNCKSDVVLSSIGNLFRSGDTLFGVSAMSLVLSDSSNRLYLDKWLRNPRINSLLSLKRHASPQ